MLVPMDSEHQPRLLDTLTLVGLQLAVSLAIAAVLLVLPFDVPGNGSWVGAVGTLSGAHILGLRKETKEPGSVQKLAHRLALGATVIQIGLAGVVACVTLLVLGSDFRGADALLTPAGALIGLLTFLIGGLLVYGFTRFGLRLGIKGAEAERNRPARRG